MSHPHLRDPAIKLFGRNIPLPASNSPPDSGSDSLIPVAPQFTRIVGKLENLRLQSKLSKVRNTIINQSLLSEKYD
ncbi:hypothetical protein L484_000660 [Morus notabilis]|uniref:Uncharacterized protein n=1 Tax=Morus notabilis TaxID=981085 RepID=W9QBI7_9ROSA|nr:hypothetical protein L484_000660 [Morus notabilis]